MIILGLKKIDRESSYILIFYIIYYQFENDHFYGKKILPGGILQSHSKGGLKAKQKVGGTY